MQYQHSTSTWQRQTTRAVVSVPPVPIPRLWQHFAAAHHVAVHVHRQESCQVDELDQDLRPRRDEEVLAPEAPHGARSPGLQNATAKPYRHAKQQRQAHTGHADVARLQQHAAQQRVAVAGLPALANIGGGGGGGAGMALASGTRAEESTDPASGSRRLCTHWARNSHRSSPQATSPVARCSIVLVLKKINRRRKIGRRLGKPAREADSNLPGLGYSSPDILPG